MHLRWLQPSPLDGQYRWLQLARRRRAPWARRPPSSKVQFSWCVGTTAGRCAVGTRAIGTVVGCATTTTATTTTATKQPKTMDERRVGSPSLFYVWWRGLLRDADGAEFVELLDFGES